MSCVLKKHNITPWLYWTTESPYSITAWKVIWNILLNQVFLPTPIVFTTFQVVYGSWDAQEERIEQRMKFVNPRNDVAFKKILGNGEHQEILISFLNAVLDLTGEKEMALW